MPVRITGGVRMMISLGYTFLISQRSMSILLLSRSSGVRVCATHRRQPTRLPRPWDSPGKNTGVGCHFLLQYMKVKVKSLSRVRLLATPWTAAYQAPPSMGFSRQEYWSGCHCLLHYKCIRKLKKKKEYHKVDEYVCLNLN